MRRTLLSRSLTVLALLFCWRLNGFGYPGKHLKLADLVSASGVIAVVNVSEIHKTATIVADIDGKDVKALVYEADLLLNRLVKGNCPDEFSVPFYLPVDFMGYPGIETGTQLVFLRTVDGHLVFSDPIFLHFRQLLVPMCRVPRCPM